jgi:hypothetical protein
LGLLRRERLTSPAFAQIVGLVRNPDAACHPEPDLPLHVSTNLDPLSAYSVKLLFRSAILRETVVQPNAAL